MFVVTNLILLLSALRSSSSFKSLLVFTFLSSNFCILTETTKAYTQTLFNEIILKHPQNMKISNSMKLITNFVLLANSITTILQGTHRNL